MERGKGGEDFIQNIMRRYPVIFTYGAIKLIEETGLEEATIENIVSNCIENGIKIISEKDIERRIHTKRIFQSIKTFTPKAKELAENLQIELSLDDKNIIKPSDSIENNIKALRDRYRKIYSILRKRIPRGLYEISDLKKIEDGKTGYIVGMVLTIVKGKRILVEDPTDNCNIIISERILNRGNREKLKFVTKDAVLGFQILKKWGKVFYKDVIFPEFEEPPNEGENEEVAVLLTSDLHVGSKYFNRKKFEILIEWLKGRRGREELAGKVKYIIIAGDLVDGIGIYPSQRFELSITDLHRQYQNVAEILSAIPDYISIIIIPGNHDATYRGIPQPPIFKEFREVFDGLPIKFLSNPAIVRIFGKRFLIEHGEVLESVSNNLENVSHNEPARLMLHFLRLRNFAPISEGRIMVNIQPNDLFTILAVPNVFHMGHIHVYGYEKYRNVHIINSGTWQEMTPYQERLGLQPTPGIFGVFDFTKGRIHNLSIGEVS